MRMGVYLILSSVTIAALNMMWYVRKVAWKYIIFYDEFLPSGHDVLAIAGDGDDDSPAGLSGGPVGNLGVNLTIFEFVTVEINVDDEIVDTVQFVVRICDDKTFRCVNFAFTWEANNTRIRSKLCLFHFSL